MCTCIIIGTIIGAGFASGQEIASFFNRYGINGIYGIIVACVLFGIVSIVVTMLVSKNGIENYKMLVKENKSIIFVMESFTFICFCIMVSGIATFIEELFGVSFWRSAIVSGVVCYIMLLKRFTGMEKINMILVPSIIIGMILLGTKEYDPTAFQINDSLLISKTFTNSWLISSVLYMSYNAIILLPVLTTFKRYNLNKIQTIFIGISSALFLCVMALMIYSVCNIYYPQIMSLEMPTLKLAAMQGPIIKYFYSLIIISAILTTAYSTGYSFLCMRSEKNYNRNVAIMCVLAVIFSRIGFSNMINTFFPLFGYFGILQILMVIVIQLKNYKERKE